MGKLIGIAVGAGVASALLFVVSATASLAAVAFAYLTPLPIMIAALGFGQASGSLAALIGSGAIALALGPLSGMTFMLILGFPAWWLAYVFLLARPSPQGTTEWYPVSKVVLWVATLAAGPVLLIGGMIVLRYGGFGLAVTAMESRLHTIFGGASLPGGLSYGDLVRAAPVAMAASTFLMLAFNLWLGGRIVLISQRLTRPWPAIAEGIKLPRGVAILFLALMAGIFVLPDPARVIAAVVAGALAMAFVAEGLAAAHVLTRGLTARRAILGAIYAVVVILIPWPLFALIVLGCLDCLFALRGKPSLPIPPTTI